MTTFTHCKKILLRKKTSPRLHFFSLFWSIDWLASSLFQMDFKNLVKNIIRTHRHSIERSLLWKHRTVLTKKALAYLGQYLNWTKVAQWTALTFFPSLKKLPNRWKFFLIWSPVKFYWLAQFQSFAANFSSKAWRLSLNFRFEENIHVQTWLL